MKQFTCIFLISSVDSFWLSGFSIFKVLFLHFLSPNCQMKHFYSLSFYNNCCSALIVFLSHRDKRFTISSDQSFILVTLFILLCISVSSSSYMPFCFLTLPIPYFIFSQFILCLIILILIWLLILIILSHMLFLSSEYLLGSTDLQHWAFSDVTFSTIPVAFVFYLSTTFYYFCILDWCQSLLLHLY